MQEKVGDHPLWHIPYMPAPFNTVHSDTVVITWIGMAIVLVTVGVLAGLHPVTKLSKRYTVMELLVTGIGSQVETILGRNGVPFVPFILSLFLFIFVMNEIGLFPFIGQSPTSDLNTTAALAILAILLINGVGVARKGLKYFGHLFVRPLALGIPLFPIMLVDELVRPVTLAMRLFGNIFAGEILLLVVASIIAGHLGFLSTAANAGPIVIYAFNMIIGLIQAVVFTLLTTAYLITPLSDEAH
ncbi:MAG TPA: F0F1 ATP synthase subunit A [Candidatus Eremiobacteraceae bacterium]|nr:F0F1 ATP synthase subunit A [Candidatus Eremiobacteraceae bacterium]